ncbi:unnamed protein product [Bursaphelenchus okinawaensis]|uniref:EF-hand domain-containing protein n=1 Tax=Bursaphelenchus okinawaensis TaxID=465554 RepID=A0A811K6D8_9BILA|nr:unnamed protein product [Bursaphelenchus okinawaensis]CAG9092382.1 unnamed protein product [Bursaphelenchus okinawaensis]
MWIVARWRTLRERPTRSTRCVFYGGHALNDRMKKPTPSERRRNLERHYGTVEFHCRFGNSFLASLYWGFRRIHYFLCFYDNDVEVDVEDLLINPFNTQPPALDDLQRLTGFRRDWIMFLYRNFKQISANGRMSQMQWRQIFRLIFKGTTDYEFADRLFNAIVGTRSHRMITFEDLIVCIYDLTQSFQASNDSIDDSVPSTTKAQFTFCLMQPDDKGRVDIETFTNYVECIYNLNASLKGSAASGDAATLGIISGSTHGSQYYGDKGKKEVSQPWVQAMAKQQFKAIDLDEDGYIMLKDVQRLFNDREDIYKGIILKKESQIDF